MGPRQVKFDVRWRPFQLNPDAPKEGMNKMEYYKSKFGVARTQQMLPYVAQNFDKVVTLTWDDASMWPPW